jgi:hypothetical protein
MAVARNAKLQIRKVAENFVMKQARKTWGFVIDAPVADAPDERDIRIV